VFILFIIALAWFGYAVTRGLRQNIYSDGLCTFCQSQRAMGIWSILRFGRCELPALGPGGKDGDDWRVPFEWPLYQWLAALTGRLLNRALRICRVSVFHVVSIETAGRLVGIASYLAVVAAAIVAGPAIGLAGSSCWILPALLLASPLYIAWARTVMIDTTALAFNGWYLAALLWLLHVPMHHFAPFWCMGIAAIVCGVLGSLVKINAASVCWLAGLVAAAACPSRLPALVLWAGVTAPAVFAGVLWTRWADSIKERHPLSRLTQISTLPAQRAWNFGTWSSKLSPDTWRRILGRERRFSPLGIFAAVAACLICQRWAGLACLGVYLAGPAIWTHVTAVHEDGHYHLAFGVFLLAAIAIAISAAGPFAATVALGIMLVRLGLVWWFDYRPRQLASAKHLDAWARQLTEKASEGGGDDGILILVGFDWDPTLAYLARRRALYVPNWPEVTPAAVAGSIELLTRGNRGRRVHLLAVGNAARVSAEFVAAELLRRSRVSTGASCGTGTVAAAAAAG